MSKKEYENEDCVEEEGYADIVKSWGIKEWIGVLLIPIVIISYFFFPLEKEGESKQTGVNLEQVKSEEIPLFTQGDVLIMNGDIRKNMPENINFVAYSGEREPLPVSIRNGWIVLDPNDNHDRGQIKKYNSPDFNCLGFERTAKFSIAMYGVKGAKESFFICQSLSDIELVSRAHDTKKPINEKTLFKIKKGELFFIEDQNALGTVSPLYLRLKISD